ncbi:MAG: dihydrolipoamide acetyltransferase family protein [Clostridiaceae bacterium]|nr:dihydrolipoamide acetyltransferase family protein [Clostridiaceae bacterium]
MAEKITMPKLGLTMTEGTVVKWLKKEGEAVKEGEPLFEVETDKISNEIASTASGILLKIITAEGDKAKVKETVAVIGEAGENYLDALNGEVPIERKKEEAGTTPKAEAVIKKEKEASSYVLASPLAKKTAKDKGIELNRINGTGPKGRIVEKDVLDYKEQSVRSSAMAVKTAERLGVDIGSISQSTRIMTEDVIRFYKNNRIEEMAEPGDTIVPMTQMRRVISERMSQSWNISPAVTYEISADMTKLSQLKNDLKEFVKLTYTDLIVKIVSKVLLKHPALNSTIDSEREEIIQRNYVNMSVAVALKEGLIVPVVKYANIKDLKQISEEIKELAEKARTNTLTADDLSGGTFTVTNIGMYGIEAFSPIINQPQTAILGICTITNTPVVNEKLEIEVKPLMKLCLTADHRAIDGSVAAEFMQDIKKHMENPAFLVV